VGLGFNFLLWHVSLEFAHPMAGSQSDPDGAPPRAAGKNVIPTIYLFGQSDARCPDSPQLKQAPLKLLLLQMVESCYFWKYKDHHAHIRL
jgi:hypothetical protein